MLLVLDGEFEVVVNSIEYWLAVITVGTFLFMSLVLTSKSIQFNVFTKSSQATATRVILLLHDRYAVASNINVTLGTN